MLKSILLGLLSHSRGENCLLHFAKWTVTVCSRLLKLQKVEYSYLGIVVHISILLTTAVFIIISTLKTSIEQVNRVET